MTAGPRPATRASSAPRPASAVGRGGRRDGGTALARRLVAAALVVGLALAAAPGPAAAAAPGDETRVLALVNAERAARSLRALAWEPRLARAAAQHAAAMATRDFFAHRDPDGRDLLGRAAAHGYAGWRYMGENLAAGQRTPERVVRAWMDSPSHRANVLAPAACAAGVGRADGATSRYRRYWVLETGC